MEARWRDRWAESCCFAAPDVPSGPKFFNYDSGPFPSGPLHLGHVRTYVLGDLTARRQRLLGRSVLYATEWDSFGLPNELAALKNGATPREYTALWIGRMREQLEHLGISYDWPRVPDTSSPEYYRWTQWLFVKLLQWGLIERREAELDRCESCATTLARSQVERGRCWRCRGPVTRVRLAQWFVKLSLFSEHLVLGLPRLTGWSERARRLVAGFIGRGQRRDARGGYRVHDWMISRQRSWGAPVPVIHCPRCGPVPVPERDLPVRLPEESIQWARGAGALASCAPFVHAACPACGAAAQRDTDTLDCYFDDIWCFLACLVPPGQLPFDAGRLSAWMPMDRFHSGLDTFFYLHLHRFLGAVLAKQGLLEDPEPIRAYLGHEMVLLEGRKMSKHLGNAVAARPLLRRHGADALRAAVLLAASPEHPVRWSPACMERGARFVAETEKACDLVIRTLRGGEPGEGGSQAVTAAAGALEEECRRAAMRAGSLMDEYRPHAALAELAVQLRHLERFARRRAASRRLSIADARLLRGGLQEILTALSPCVPHIAEEHWSSLGGRPLLATARRPPEAVRDAPHAGRDGGSGAGVFLRG